MIQNRSFYEEIISNGKTYPLRKVGLYFNTTGNVIKILCKNGTTVYKDSILGVLDNTLQKLDLNNARIQVESAKIELKSCMLGYGATIQDSSAMSGLVYDNLKIQSGYVQAMNNWERAKLQYRHTILKAPFTGLITDMNTCAHDKITPYDLFCNLMDTDRFVAEFQIIEHELPMIFIGQTVKVSPFAYDSVVIAGRISEINPSVDEDGLVSVKAIIPNSKNLLFDGMNVKIIIKREIKHQIVIPKQALLIRSNREVVFTYESGYAKWNYVRINKENSTSYLISEGLHPGDSVITSGNTYLAHNARVKLEI